MYEAKEANTLGFFGKAKTEYQNAVDTALENAYRNATGLKNCDVATFMTIFINDASQELKITYVFGSEGSTDATQMEQCTFEIPFTRLCSVKTYSEQEIIEKQKSVLKRALVGGVMLGGVGAVVGGLSGVGNKQKSKERYYIGIEYTETDGTKNIISGEYNVLTDQITPGLIKNIHERMKNLPVSNKDVSESSVDEAAGDVVEQLEKLLELKTKGVIDEDEFKALKLKLLSKL